MSKTRYASVLGLGFGDCGKGLFVDALTRDWKAHTVVRFSGGAQAGHNVVTPEEAGSPSRHHTFSQFSAGTLVPGTLTVLLDPMVVHPTALLVEAEALARIGVHDALARLTIDSTCRVTTPFHQAAGRLRERLRNQGAHGTCGVGVGETVRQALEQPALALRYAELTQGKRSMEKLQALRELLLVEFQAQCSTSDDEAVKIELLVLQDEALAGRWLNTARAVARQCVPASTEEIAMLLKEPGCVLFEGAQGMLLDEWRGFHPHTTWSSVTTHAVEDAVARFGLESIIEHYGVQRTYLTRHGAGPLPTYDAALSDPLPELYNASDGWQGSFRCGHPDAVLLRYALEAMGALSGLLISHLDVFQRGVSLRWCEAYTTASSPLTFHERLPLGTQGDLSHQARLTQLLQEAQPQYAPEAIHTEQAYLDHLAHVTALPILRRSYGNTHRQVKA